ncbi:hypothetical protein Krac_10304 [Ktedonobacter racemifer DSM 44963]|uniref:Uncharacterized protein n=1 Tax=Ktedonobacter racemifer DSM 44963 TaxID=485913 RepID=D6TGA3_KTERA|nr:hypothetical protein Krac_10304 [Ktedonobacter racemifer DSM 44963]
MFQLANRWGYKKRSNFLQAPVFKPGSMTPDQYEDAVTTPHGESRGLLSKPKLPDGSVRAKTYLLSCVRMRLVSS